MAKGLIWGLFLCLMAQAAPALPPPGFEVAVEGRDPQRKARKANKAYGGPLVDTHAHLYPPPKKDATVGDIRRSDLRQILALLEAHPRRFVVGTDFHFGRKGVELRKYKRRVRQVRKILGTLNPRAARLIAHDNARRMFPIEASQIEANQN